MTERVRRMGMPRRRDVVGTRQDGDVTGVVQKGQLLVATPSLREPTFARTVIALLEHDDENGSVGVVLNRPMSVAVSEVVDAVSDLVTAPPTLFDGGPVA